MKCRSHLVLYATVVAWPVLAQDVTAYSTTIAQGWKQNNANLSQGTYAPATEYLGVDVARIGGRDALSLHIYGWGQADLADQSSLYGKHTGDLTYGYLQYNFSQANAVLKAGRFTVNGGVGNEQVDGVSARTDLRLGFAVSGFAGLPVIYKNLGDQSQATIASQQNLIYGARLAWRNAKLGELGVDFVEDGTSPGNPSPTGMPPVDFTRRFMGADLKLTRWSWLDVTGRTVYDVSPRAEPAPNANLSRIAEDDYTATFKVNPKLSIAGTFVERNFFAYYAGSTLPTLFNQDEQGMFKAAGGKATWQATESLQVVADVRRTDRTTYGTATRAGADLRYKFADGRAMAGAGYHQVNAFTLAPKPDSVIPAYSLSHSETRAWVMVEQKAWCYSLDGIAFHYADAGLNPNLNGHSFEGLLLGSVGYQAKSSLKVSGDLSYGDTPMYQRQVTVLARVEYRFPAAAKGDK
jgi:hypothetical protein